MHPRPVHELEIQRDIYGACRGSALWRRYPACQGAPRLDVSVHGCGAVLPR